MKPLLTTSITLIAFSLLSCAQRKNDKAFQVFNEGVILNMQAVEAQNKGDLQKSASLNKQSIDKFRETLKLDSTHPIARGALGHSLYLDMQFREAIQWFDQANKTNGEAAANYREMGLCKINIGQIQEGKEAIDKAFAKDTGQEIRKITIQDLIDIGKLAFEYGDGYIKQGEPDKGREYKRFSVAVLLLAFEYDKSRKDIASTIADFAEKIGEKETAAIYKALSE